MLYCRQAKNDMSLQWVYEINLPGVVTPGRIMNIKIAEFLMPVAHGFDQILKSSYFFFRNT